MTISRQKNKTPHPLAPSNAGSDSNIGDVTIQNDVTITDELAALRALCEQAEAARADLDNDFPVGAVARGKWQEARRGMAEACPRLLDHIASLGIQFDANVERLKACEHIAEGDDGWETLINMCPSTVAVAALRDHCNALREALNGFMERRADLRPLLYDEFNRAQRALDGDSPFNPDGN